MKNDDDLRNASRRPSRPQPGAWVTDSECYFVRGADTAALASAGNDDGTGDQLTELSAPSAQKEGAVAKNGRLGLSIN